MKKIVLSLIIFFGLFFVCDINATNDPNGAKAEKCIYTMKNGELYCSINGYNIVSKTVNGFTFDEKGRYTIGNKTLDNYVRDIIKKNITDNMKEEEKIRILYNHMRDNYKYIKRSLIKKGQTNWSKKRAEDFFKDKKGNCYSYASAFCYLLKQSGIDAHIVMGEAGQRKIEKHSWVAIKLSNGKTYLYDPELEMAYKKSKNPKKFYKFVYSTSPIKYTPYVGDESAY